MTEPALLAQDGLALAATPQQLETYVFRTPQQSFQDDPWPAFATAAYRRALFFLHSGHPELARMQTQALRDYAPDSPLLARLESDLPSPPSSTPAADASHPAPR